MDLLVLCVTYLTVFVNCLVVKGLVGWGGVMSLDYMCIWQVQLSVYCARRIPAHLMGAQCSILLHFIDICFLQCICLWQISQIQTCFGVAVGPGLVSTSPSFMGSSASNQVGPPFLGAGAVDTICTAGLPNLCDSYNACRLCRRHCLVRQQDRINEHMIV